MGSSIFAKTAVLALFVIALSYSSFLFTVFTKGATEIAIPKANTYAYMFSLNESDPMSEKVLNYSETKYAQYTSFSFNSLSENMFANYTYDYTYATIFHLPLINASVFQHRQTHGFRIYVCNYF